MFEGPIELMRKSDDWSDADAVIMGPNNRSVMHWGHGHVLEKMIELGKRRRVLLAEQQERGRAAGLAPPKRQVYESTPYHQHLANDMPWSIEDQPTKNLDKLLALLNERKHMDPIVLLSERKRTDYVRDREHPGGIPRDKHIEGMPKQAYEVLAKAWDAAGRQAARDAMDAQRSGLLNSKGVNAALDEQQNAEDDCTLAAREPKPEQQPTPTPVLMPAEGSIARRSEPARPRRPRAQRPMVASTSAV